MARKVVPSMYPKVLTEWSRRNTPRFPQRDALKTMERRGRWPGPGCGEEGLALTSDYCKLSFDGSSYLIENGASAPGPWRGGGAIAGHGRRGRRTISAKPRVTTYEVHG